jgi:hypothetical protein
MRSVSLFSAIALVATLFAVAACSKQAEGERCETNADCENGLTCRTNARGVQLFGICCGPVGQEGIDECRGSAPTPLPDAPPPDVVVEADPAPETGDPDATGDVEGPEAETPVENDADAGAETVDDATEAG